MEGDVEGKRYRIGASKFVTENIESSKSSRPGMWIALSEDGETVAWFRITSQLRTNIIPGISLLKK